MGPVMAEARPDKPAWRARLKSARAALPETERASASARIRMQVLALDAVREARTVFCFVSRGDEVETHALIDALAAGGRTVLVPRVAGPEDMIAVEFPGWAALKPGVLGIPAPASERPYAGRVDVVITPGLGFTADGARLGMGRGYYDRWFAAHPCGLSMGVCFECQLVPGLPATATDVPVDLIVTEQRVVRTGSRR